MTVVRNLTASPIALNDLGLTVPASGTYDLSLENERDVRRSVDLSNQITAGNLVFLDAQGNQRTLAQSQDYLQHQSTLIPALTIQQDGSNIAGTPHNTLNFDNFLVFSDSGTGVVTVKAKGTSANVIEVTQTAHGFTQGQALYLDDNDDTWKLARSDNVSTLGIALADIINVNSFNAIIVGRISGLTGLSPGEYYFVSPTTAGQLTVTKPSSPNYVNPVMYALTPTVGIVIPVRPNIESTAGAQVAIEQGRHTMWLPAGSMIGKITAGADFSTAEVGTAQVIMPTYDFDAAVNQFTQFTIAMPKSWNEGTMTFQFLWTQAAAGTGNVIWSIRALALSDTDPIGTATWGTAVTVTDTGGTTNLVYTSPETGPMTVGNTPTENDMVVFEVSRSATAGGDTLTVDAKLIGVRIFYTINASTDA